VVAKPSGLPILGATEESVMRFNKNESMSQNQMDFVPREQRAQRRNLIIVFFLATLVVFAINYFLAEKYHAFGASISAATVAILGFYILYRRQHNLDLVMTTEYQNLLFAQAVSLGTSFCMFARRDGTIVYANDGVRDLFPYFSYSDSQLLDAIFEAGSVPKVDRERLLSTIYSSGTDRLVFPIKSNTGEVKQYVLTVEPLARPSGFSVIRAREYLSTRAGTQLLPDLLRATSSDKLDHMLTHTPIAHFTTDPYGRLEYINPAMEKLLGYESGEMIANKLTLRQVIFQLAGRTLPDDYTLTDFSGNSAMQHKSGTHVPVLLFQHALRDSTGKIAGVTGSMMPVGVSQHAG